MPKFRLIYVFFCCLGAILGIFLVSRGVFAVEYGPGTTFFIDTFDSYDLDDLPSPFATFGTNGDLPVVSDDEYFGPNGNRSVKFVSGASDIDRFKYQVDEAAALYSDDFRGFFYVASTGSDNAIVFARGSSTTAKQSIVCVASTQTCTIEGHTIVDDFTYDEWHFFDLQWDFDANTTTGCIDDTCYGPHTPGDALDTDYDYAMVYQTTGALRNTYVDCLGCSYDFIEEYTNYIPATTPTESEFSQYIAMFQTKFPFATIDFLYDYFFNLSVPSVF